MCYFCILKSTDFSDSLDRLDVSQTAEAEKTKAALKKMEGDMGDQLASSDLKKEVRIEVEVGSLTHSLIRILIFFLSYFNPYFQEIMAKFNEFSGKSQQTLADLELKSLESTKTNSASIDKLSVEMESKISLINGNFLDTVTAAVAEEIEKVSKPSFLRGLNRIY